MIFLSFKPLLAKTVVGALLRRRQNKAPGASVVLT